LSLPDPGWMHQEGKSMTETILHPSVIRHPDRFYIDGEWVGPSSDSTIQVIRPSTEELYLTVAEAQAADIERAIASARLAFDKGSWPRMSHAERASYLNEIGKQVAARASSLGAAWTSEMGIVSEKTKIMVPGVGGVYQYYASLADTFAFEESRAPSTGGFGLLVREPVGVVAAIVPWNGPLSLIAWKIAPALLAGCTVIVKVSPEAPSAGYLMAEIMEAVGLPKGVYNMVTADREVSEMLVRHPDVDKVTFTGSCEAGKKIAAACGERIARCTLELGGKSPAIILDDYDLETAAQSLSQSARIMSGQICSSLTRIIVSRNRQKALLEAMAASFSAIKVGDPFAASTDMGPLAMRRQRDKVEDYIAKGKAAGATVATGGKRPAHLDRGFFIEPTVFGDVNNDMAIAREEIFGPVVSVIPADSIEQAVDIANDTIFGLNASVFTNDSDRAYKIARKLRSGTVGHNAFKTDFSIAFGGFKQSGLGREGGTEGLLPFLETKTIILDGPPEHIG
jgi:aldehyde dehydrogenase (NAD+)